LPRKLLEMGKEDVVVARGTKFQNLENLEEKTKGKSKAAKRHTCSGRKVWKEKTPGNEAIFHERSKTCVLINDHERQDATRSRVRQKEKDEGPHSEVFPERVEGKLKQSAKRRFKR